MGKYTDDATKLLKDIGGKENISAVTHCATRMRFVLNDDSKADKDAIENISSVKGMFTNAGQFQVIIGNDVPTFYNDFAAVSGVEGVSKEQVKGAAQQHQNIVQKAVAILAEIFTPLLPAIVIGGLILGFRNILGDIQFGGQTIVEMSQFWAGVNDFLWLIGEAIFQFLPVGITWSVTKKMGTTQILGIVLGITLVSPQLLNAYAVASTKVADIPFWDFGFAQVDKIGYQAQVIPAMLAGFMLAYLERFFRKHVPEVVSMIFVPLLALVPTVIAAHVILGPIGWTIGSWISAVVNMGLTSSLSWLFGALFGFIYSPLVITGLHHTTLAIDAQLIADFGTTNLWPMIALSNIAQGSAVLAVIFLHKGNEKEEQISIPATISAYLGVTEPAMFGINLKYIYPFVAAMIGSGIAGMFVTLMGVRANSIGVGGLPGFLSVRIQDWVPFFIGMAISIVVPFFLTIFFRRAGIFNKLDPVTPVTANVAPTPAATKAPVVTETETTSNEVQTVEFHAPVNGVLIPISEVSDPVFSEKMMGDGYAVQPTDGAIYSPVAGKIINVFETKHALGFEMSSGLEILLHMGLDTVELKGAPFEIKVQAGDVVTADTLIATVDLKQIIDAGKATDMIVAITNMEKVAKFDLQKTGNVSAKETIGSATTN
ncbi:PTS system trehalose-specific EIIBC component [Carnobacterium gallinarum]|uniref:PTS system trehalose-specific EIIBC component n=1 Tax=Carnobacterium gallinarum TaxID=2749 RepID=UPI0005565D94|nr:PTS system trehalose-specific EIIBC component [Carnobacterium gallinarum]